MSRKHKRHTSATSAPSQISSAQLHVFLDISPDALLLVNQTGMIVMVNAQLAALFGYSAEELCHMFVEDLLPHRYRESHISQRQQYFTTPRARPMGAELALWGLRKDGSEFPVDISLKPLLLDGVSHTLGAVRDMTTQFVAERERAAQAQRLSLLTDVINLAPDAVLMRDPVSRITFWNHGAEQLYGWSAQEALGRITHHLLRTRFPQSRTAIDITLEQQGWWEGELMHVSSDGRSILVESRQALVRDEKGIPLAILEVNRDITERSSREQAERAHFVETVERERVFRTIFDELPCGVFIVEGYDARLLFANRAACQVWGAEWTLQQPMLEFFSSIGLTLLDDRGRPLSEEQYATIRALCKGETSRSIQSLTRRSDGVTLPLLVYAGPISFPPNTGMSTTEPMALVAYQDVTMLKEAEYLKDEFVGIAAHELRTPLTVLSSYVDLLLRQSARGREGPLSERQQRALAMIKQATTRLSLLIEDLLDVTRLQAGRLIVRCSPLNVVPLVERVAIQCQQTTERHHIEVGTTQETVMALVDENRLEQIMINLIGNAIKYSPQGGPVSIFIKDDPSHQQICIKVQDEGIGIPQHQHVNIFGRFMRAENAQAWQISGTGLGLYLCRELVELMGGCIWFESEENVGSTFYVSLPRV